MKENHQYPLENHWTTDEMITVIDLYQAVEKAYETGISTQELLTKYQQFKKVVPAIGEEKRLGRQFEEESGYSIYRTIQAAKQTNKAKMKMSCK